jgi:hypothetical protein
VIDVSRILTVHFVTPLDHTEVVVVSTGESSANTFFQSMPYTRTANDVSFKILWIY